MFIPHALLCTIPVIRVNNFHFLEEIQSVSLHLPGNTVKAYFWSRVSSFLYFHCELGEMDSTFGFSCSKRPLGTQLGYNSRDDCFLSLLRHCTCYFER